MRSATHAIKLLSLACCLCLGVTACAKQTNSTSGKPLVATSFTVLADIARNVAGDHIDVVSITKNGAEIHGYEPTPSDIAAVSKADLVIDNGMGLELWFEQFMQEVKVPRITASAGITPIPIAEDAYAGRDNPHAWMSPSNVKIYANNIAHAFAELDPAHADTYIANAKAYGDELDALRTRLATTLDELPEQQRALVTCEGAFSYLTHDLGLKEKYLWAVNAENQATPGQIAEAITFVNTNKIPAVFCESTVSDKPMQQVVDATDAKFGGTLYVDSLSEDNGPVPTYLDLIEYDLKIIAEGLTGRNQ